MELLSKKNIKPVGETVSGSMMYTLTDPKGKEITPLFRGLDYQDALITVDFINRGLVHAYKIRESLEILSERGFKFYTQLLKVCNKKETKK